MFFFFKETLIKGLKSAEKKLIFKLLQQVNKKNQTNKNINKTTLCLTILNFFDNQLKIEKVISHK